MFNRLSLRTSIFIVIAAIALIASVMIMLIAESIGQKHILESAFNNLRSLREIKADQIENYIKLNRNQAVVFSDEQSVVEALHSFNRAYNALPEELNKLGVNDRDISNSLLNYYDNKFLPELELNIDSEVYSDDLIPVSISARTLQYLYVSNNPFPLGEHHQLTSLESEIEYATVHEKYHELFRSYQEKFGYYDIFLVDSKTGNIVYSVFKEVDFATSLKDGPYSDLKIAKLFQKASQASYKGFVEIIDFEPYIPSYNSPASFIASPIFDGNDNVGVLIFQMPIEKINEIMTYKYSWKNVGLGESGETYIIGDDFKLRNQSRFLVESKVQYLDAIQSSGVGPETVNKIDNLNTSIGLQQTSQSST